MRDKLQARGFRWVVGRLSIFVFCVLVFEGLLIAVVPRLHSGSVLKIAKDAVSLRIRNDSWYYMAQGDVAWRQSPQTIYETVFFQRDIRFIYPPTSLLAYRSWLTANKLHIRPFEALKFTLLISMVGTWIAATMFFFRLLPSEVSEASSRVQRWAVRILLATLILTFLPLVNAWMLGQVQTILSFLLIASSLLWQRSRRVAPGLLIGLTCWLKPQMALFLLWGLFRKQWSFAISLAAMLLLGVAVSMAVFGLHNSAEYLTVLNYLNQHGEALWTNQSLNGLLHRMLHVGSPVTWAYGYAPYNRGIYLATAISSGLLLFAASILPVARRMQTTTADFLLFAMAATMASPIAWDHHYGIFFMVFLMWMPRAFRNWKLFAGLLSLYLLMTDNWAPLSLLMNTRWTFLISHVYFGGLLLFFWTLFYWKEQPEFTAHSPLRNY